MINNGNTHTIMQQQWCAYKRIKAAIYYYARGMQ